MSEILKTAAHPMVFPWLCLAFGLVVGSFLNVVIHRLPKMMERDWQEECAELRGEAVTAAERVNVYVPRSGCPACGHALTAVENIPRVFWAVLRGGGSAAMARGTRRSQRVGVLAGRHPARP